MRIKKSSGLIALVCTFASIGWLFFKKDLTLAALSGCAVSLGLILFDHRRVSLGLCLWLL
jgi:hypothetical protein